MVAHGTNRGEREKTAQAPSGATDTDTRFSFAATRLRPSADETHGSRRGLPSYAAPQLTACDQKLIYAQKVGASDKLVPDCHSGCYPPLPGTHYR